MILEGRSAWEYVLNCSIRLNQATWASGLRHRLSQQSSNTVADLQLSQAIGGSIWHGVKGFRNSPYGERRIGAITAIKARAPVLGGNFGVWGGLFSTFDCAIKGMRKKEDPYNASMNTFGFLMQDVASG